MSYKTLPDFSLPDITLRTLLSSRKFSQNKTLQGQISPGTILSSRNWELSQDITLQGQNSPVHNFPEDKTLRVQNSPGTNFSQYNIAPTEKTLPFQNKCIVEIGNFYIGTKLSRLEYCHYSHRDKTLPYVQSGKITYGTKPSHMDFCRFWHRDKTLPFFWKWPNWVYGTKLSRFLKKAK